MQALARVIARVGLVRAALLASAGAGAVAGSVALAPWSKAPAPCCAQAPSRERFGRGPAAPEPARDGGATQQQEGDEGMVWIPGGAFEMGSDDPAARDARPWHEVFVDGFWIDRTEVTNAAFERFVAATGYVTTAERALGGEKPSGIVFQPPEGTADVRDPLSWWRLVPGADWRHPEGPGSSITARALHPVVQVSWDDAVAYAAWSGKRLPTEAEWERAARGGAARKPFVWGDERTPGGRWLANVWQGRFPTENTRADGFERSAPVGSFPPNGFGLFDMAGNVWEWCADWYAPDTYERSPRTNPRGPAESLDPDEPSAPKRVTRGGSFLCGDEYCRRYGPGTRGKASPDSGASHMGFRCVRSGGAEVAPR